MRRSAFRLIEPAALLALFGADRVSKLWAQQWLMPRGSFPVAPFFHFTYVENTGAAWGVMRGNNLILIAISIALLGGLCYMRRGWRDAGFFLRFGSVLVAAGALGNLYDRIAFGAVVDFLDFRIWPVFNLADSCISVGACALAWGLHQADKAAAAKVSVE